MVLTYPKYPFTAHLDGNKSKHKKWHHLRLRVESIDK